MHDAPTAPRALVAGAGGFLGRAVCRALRAHGWEVHTLAASDRAHAARAVARARPAVIIDVSRDRVADAAGAPAPTSSDLVRAAATADIPILLCGTYLQFDRHWRPHERTVHARGRTELVELAATLEARASLLVPMSLWGPDDHRGKLLPTLLAAATTGEPALLADPDDALDLVHADDAATRVVELAAHAHASQIRLAGVPVHPLATGTATTLRELVEAVGCVTGSAIDARWHAVASRAWARDVPYSPVPHPIAPRDLVTDVRGWLPLPR